MQQARANAALDVSAYRAYLVTACLILAGVERREDDVEPYIDEVDDCARALVGALDRRTEE